MRPRATCSPSGTRNPTHERHFSSSSGQLAPDRPGHHAHAADVVRTAAPPPTTLPPRCSAPCCRWAASSSSHSVGFWRVLACGADEAYSSQRRPTWSSARCGSWSSTSASARAPRAFCIPLHCWWLIRRHPGLRARWSLFTRSCLLPRCGANDASRTGPAFWSCARKSPAYREAAATDEPLYDQLAGGGARDCA